MAVNEDVIYEKKLGNVDVKKSRIKHAFVKVILIRLSHNLVIIILLTCFISLMISVKSIVK